MTQVSSFDDSRALEEFRPEPEHGKVGEYLLKVANRIVVDYEFKGLSVRMDATCLRWRLLERLDSQTGTPDHPTRTRGY